MPRQPLGKHSSTRSHAAGPSARNRHDLGPSRQPHVAEAYVWRGAHQQTAKGQSRSLGTRKVKTQTCCRQAASKRGHPLSHSQPTGKWEGRGPPHLKGPRAVGLQPSEPQLSTCWGETTPQGRHADETEAQGKRLANYGGHTDVGGGVLEENPTAQIKGEAGSLPSRAGRQGGQLWGARTRPRLLPQELREARQDPGRSRHSAPPRPPRPAWPTLAPQAPAERAGFTDTRAPGPRPPPQGTRPALVRATQQHPRDDTHQLPDHSPCAVGPAGQAIGREEEGLQVVCELVPVGHGATGICAAVDQLTILQAGGRQGNVSSTGWGQNTFVSAH